MSVLAELETRVRIADPNPAYCVACLQAPHDNLRFVDFQAVADRGTIVDPISGGLIDDLHDLKICEDCFRQGAEILEFRPSLHRVHLNAVREKEQELVALREENKKLRSLVAQEA
jgi:hypothetical protein